MRIVIRASTAVLQVTPTGAELEFSGVRNNSGIQVLGSDNIKQPAPWPARSSFGPQQDPACTLVDIMGVRSQWMTRMGPRPAQPGRHAAASLMLTRNFRRDSAPWRTSAIMMHHDFHELPGTELQLEPDSESESMMEPRSLRASGLKSLDVDSELGPGLGACH